MFMEIMMHTTPRRCVDAAIERKVWMVSNWLKVSRT